VNDDFGFALNKTSDSNRGFRVSQIDECHSSLLLRIEVLLTEKAILQRNRSGLIDQTQAAQTSNVSCVQECLTLHIREVAWHGEHNVSAGDLSILVELLESGQEEGHDLLHGESVLLAHLRHFEADFLVFKFNALCGAELFFNRDLFLAAGV
jgi:hypothetical protein